jgi:arylsulfatase A-like enzyme
LKQFFETAKKMDWYDNTLFIITADHVGKRSIRKYKTLVGSFQIPLLFYKPNSDLKGKNSSIIQQTDILPTVLEYLNYDEPYNAFGESAFDTLADKNAYMYSSQIYQILNDSLMLSFDQKETIGVYNYKKDVFLQQDIKDENAPVNTLLENKLKAVIQAHHRAMINNQLVDPN